MDNAPNEIEAKLNRLLKNIPEVSWIDITLPTGLKVKIKPLRFEEEKHIKTAFSLPGAEGEQVIKQVIGRCLDGADMDGLTIIDKDHLLFKIREISYGSTYPLQGNCNGCGATNTMRLELSSLPVNYVNPDKSYTVTLPDSKVNATFRFPTVAEESFIDTVTKRMDNISRFIVDLDGEKDAAVIHAFLRKTTVRDVDVVRSQIYTSDYGFESVIIYKCKACNKDCKTHLALNEHFFTAS